MSSAEARLDPDQVDYLLSVGEGHGLHQPVHRRARVVRAPATSRSPTVPFTSPPGRQHVSRTAVGTPYTSGMVATAGDFPVHLRVRSSSGLRCRAAPGCGRPCGSCRRASHGPRDRRARGARWRARMWPLSPTTRSGGRQEQRQVNTADLCRRMAPLRHRLAARLRSSGTSTVGPSSHVTGQRAVPADVPGDGPGGERYAAAGRRRPAFPHRSMWTTSGSGSPGDKERKNVVQHRRCSATIPGRPRPNG